MHARSDLLSKTIAFQLMFIIVVFIAESTNMVYSEGFRGFIGSVIAEWLDDGRKMRLTEDFIYIDPSGRRWEAPKGSVIDGASIPCLAWSFIGGPFEGNYRNASVIHDVACIERKLPWQDVHLAFYTAMRAANVDQWKARVMYGAVFHFGPRWPTVRLETRTIGGTISKVPVIEPPPTPTLQEQDFQRLVRFIEEKETLAEPVSLEEIREFR